MPFRDFLNLLIAVLLFLEAPAAAARSTCASSFSQTTATHGTSDSSIQGLRSMILAHLLANGLHPGKIRVVTTHGDQADVHVAYDSKGIGHGVLEALVNADKEGRIFIDRVAVYEDDFARKGLGILMYLALAKEAYLNGQILESNYDLNSSSTGMWKKLARLGLAKATSNQLFEFKFEVLSSPEFQQQVDALLDDFKLRPAERMDPFGNVFTHPK